MVDFTQRLKIEDIVFTHFFDNILREREEPECLRTQYQVKK